METNLTVEQVPIEQLKPADYNPRKWTDDARKGLTASIEQFGFIQPIVANSATNRKGIVIGGNFKLDIAKNKGMKTVPVVWVNIPDIKKEKELNLRLNKNQGEFDNDLLAQFDEDLLQSIGFETDELDKIFERGGSDDYDVEKKIKEIEQKKETLSKTGDIFLLGKHKVIVGDATDPLVYEKLLGDEKIKVCFTSPPYNMASNMYSEYQDNKKSEEYIDFNLKVVELTKAYLNGFIFWNISYNKNSRKEFLEIMARMAKMSGMEFLELIVWNKKHALPITSKEMLTRTYEDILLVGDSETVSSEMDLYFLGRNNRAFFNKKTNQGITNYWEVETSGSQIEGHLACFPVGLPEKGIKLCSIRNDIVFDPFGGSGSVLIACENTGRQARIIEMSSVYVDVIIDRWEKLTGGKAKKL